MITSANRADAASRSCTSTKSLDAIGAQRASSSSPPGTRTVARASSTATVGVSSRTKSTSSAPRVRRADIPPAPSVTTLEFSKWRTPSPFAKATSASELPERIITRARPVHTLLSALPSGEIPPSPLVPPSRNGTPGASKVVVVVAANGGGFSLSNGAPLSRENPSSTDTPAAKTNGERNGNGTSSGRGEARRDDSAMRGGCGGAEENGSLRRSRGDAAEEEGDLEALRKRVRELSRSQRKLTKRVARRDKTVSPLLLSVFLFRVLL